MKIFDSKSWGFNWLSETLTRIHNENQNQFNRIFWNFLVGMI
jgi:hypothetical protein